MLTPAQKARCATLAEALDARDQRPWLEAEPFLTVEEKGLIWDMRRNVHVVGQREVMPTAGKTPKAVRIEARAHDLDYWPDVAVQGDGGDDDEEQTARVCPTCGGKGCEQCGGSGRLPLDDLDDDDGGDKEDDEV